MTLSRNQKIAIGIGSGLLLGAIVYFGFIRKADDAVSEIGSTGGQGSTPAGAKPYTGAAVGKDGVKELNAIKATQGRG